MSLKECFDALGWTYNENDGGFNNIECPCGGELSFNGFFGTEVIECDKCGKCTTDLFSPIQVSNSTCTVIKPSEYDYSDGKHWIVTTNGGGILYDNGTDSQES